MSYKAKLPRKTRGLSREARKRLREAIEKFYKRARRERWHKPEYAKCNCNHASDEFLHCLARFKIEHIADIEHYDFQKASWHTCTHEEAMYGRMRYPFPPAGQWHWAVRVGDNLIIDWTARQFDPEAPFPAMWIDDRPPGIFDEDGNRLVPRGRYGDLFGSDLDSDDRLPCKAVA